MTKYQIRRLVHSTISGAGLVTNKSCTRKDLQYLVSFARQAKDSKVDRIVSVANKLQTLCTERITEYLWRKEKNIGSLFFIALYTGANIIFSRFYKKF